MPPGAQADADTATLSMCVAILGASQTGKSAIASSFLETQPRREEDDPHSDDSRLSPMPSPSLEPLRSSSSSTQTPPSTTVRYYSKTMAIGPDLFKFKIWDTPSDDQLRFMLPLYFETAAASIVTYSTNEGHRSFVVAQDIVRQIRAGNEHQIIAFVATKADLGNNTIPISEVNEFAKQYDLLPMEVNAREGQNVIALFEQIAVACKQTLEQEGGALPSRPYHIAGVDHQSVPCMPATPQKRDSDSSGRTRSMSEDDTSFHESSSEDDEEYEREVGFVEFVSRNLFGPNVHSFCMLDQEVRSPPKITEEEEEIESPEAQHTDMKARRPEWVKDETAKACSKCAASFNVFNRKHHCRACGNIFCADCSSHYTTIPFFGYNRPVRVCNDCHRKLLN